MNAVSGFTTVARRELSAYFNSIIAYIFIIVFVLVTGILYMSQFFLVGLADMRGFFSILPVILCVFLPAVTMRLWAEEKRGNTYELLLTFPIRPFELVAGKFFASLIFYLVALASTVSIPMMLLLLGRPDFGPILGGYFGSALLGAFFLALGIFISGLCRDQIVAFIIAMISCFALYLLGTEFIAASIDGWIPGFGSFLQRYLGMTQHLASFQKGVMDNGDALYFVIGTILFLVLNGFWIEGRMRPKQSTIFASAVGISVAIFLAANWFLDGLPIGRLDLTEGRIYTMSKASKKIMNGLEAPVTVKYYVSPQEKLPTGLKTLEQDVVSKLDEFQVASKGKFQYKIFHMEAANITAPEGEEESLEESLQRKGIQPFQVQSIEADEVGVRLIYSAMAVAYKERPEEIVPRVIPGNIDDLEYLIVSKVYRMTLEEKPKVTVWAPVSEETTDPNMAALFEQLGQTLPQSQKVDEYRLVPLALEYEGYETERLELGADEEIPADTHTLIVLEPERISEDDQFRLNRFLVEGGAVLLAVQNFVFEYAPAGRGGVQIVPVAKNPEINSLLEHWGLGVDERFLLDRNAEVLNLSGAARLGPFQLSVPVKLPLHIRVDQPGMNKDVSITSRLPSLLYLWGSALEVNEAKLSELGLKATVLFSSSRDSWQIPARTAPLGQEAFMPRGKELGGPYPLGVLVQGQFPNAFEDSRTEELTPAPGKLILMGAATPFQEQLFRSGGHMTLLLNSVDALALSEDLIKIRAKRPVDRSIKRVSTPGKVWWRLFVTVIVPIIIAGAGAARIFLRSQVKREYLKLAKAAV